MKKILKQVLALIPTKIPCSGVTEMSEWVNDIISTFDLPDNDSHRQAIFNMVLTLGPTITHKSKYFFAASVMKAASNQIAYNLIMEIRDNAGKPRPGEKEVASSTTEASSEVG